MVLWADSQARYPTHAGAWIQKLLALNMARNGIERLPG